MSGRRLTVQNHDRDAVGMTYVYPVVSRRAGGVSLGINLNPNNACNWRCIYCQVPELQRGAAPEIDREKLAAELRHMLRWICEGDYLERHVDPPFRRLVDLAFSGNGEPTTCRNFDAVVATVLAELEHFPQARALAPVLISNGSQLGKAEVQAGLRRLGAAGGEIWFKVDAGDAAGRERINSTTSSDASVLRHLVCASSCMRLRIQTCAFRLDGQGPDAAWLDTYLGLLGEARRAGAQIHDVLLYGLARPSMQAEAARLTPLPLQELEAIATAIRGAGFVVSTHG